MNAPPRRASPHLISQIRIKPSRSAHLVRDRIQVEAQCRPCLEARPPASPRSRMRFRFASRAYADCKPHRPSVRSVARSLVPTAVPALPESWEMICNRFVLRCGRRKWQSYNVSQLVRSRHGRARCWEPRRRHDRCIPVRKRGVVHTSGMDRVPWGGLESAKSWGALVAL